MLGHKVFQILRSRFPGTLATAIEDTTKPPFDAVDLLQGDDLIRGVDVTSFDRLHSVLADIRPDFIINCTGVIKQRDDAAVAIPSITINSLLPHKLAAFASEWGGRVIHPSTDCVFSGRRGGYTEQDQSDAEDLYGKSKFLGEIHGENSLTLRTSIIGRELAHHKSLLDWFLSQQGRTVQGYRRVIYSGVTTNQFAEVVTLVVREFPDLSGLYQVVAEPISKYDLLQKIRSAFDLDIEILPNDTEISDRSMNGDKFKAATGYVSPSWDQLVSNLASERTMYEGWLP